MTHQQEETSKPHLDISACLDAASMYDAAYHRDRDNLLGPQQAEPPKIVSVWEYLWATGRKSGVALLGSSLFVMMLLAGVMILLNGVYNGYEYWRAQPVLHWEACPDPHGPHIVIDADGPGTWSEPSLYPLPPDWGAFNLRLYMSLVCVIVLSRFASNSLLRNAKKINTGVPIQYADTAHLSAQASLVRASQEPAQESLMRASALPSEPPGVLLRAVGQGQETPPEQLVRALGEPKQA